MKVLILGSGGREHALAWKSKQSPLVTELYVMPGNPGTSLCAINIEMDPFQTDNVLSFCQNKQIDLIIPGSEALLQTGICDLLNDHGFMTYGPSKKAAQIETSKVFAKELMHKYHIPTAHFQSFTDYGKAIAYLHTQTFPIVLKYNGLASGKGVVICKHMDEATIVLRDMLVNHRYGYEEVIIEEYLEGEEFTLMCFVEGDKLYPMPICRDHKRLLDDDQGPNTGGMGMHSPVPQIPKKAIKESMDTIMNPVIQALKQEGIPYSGFLYGGLMNTPKGVKVIEFNCRFGDPEAEVLMPLLSSDLIEIILKLKQGKTVQIEWKKRAILGVVLASREYPEKNSQNEIITLPNELENTFFHMGTKKIDEEYYASGGRVLFVYQFGADLEEAFKHCYQTLSNIHFNGMQYRKDIGKHALQYRDKNKTD